MIDISTAKKGYSRKDLERIVREGDARLAAGVNNCFARKAIQSNVDWARKLLTDNPEQQRFAY